MATMIEQDTQCSEDNELTTLKRSYLETLSLLSHELKSPLATILNYAYLIRKQKLGTLTEQQRRAVAKIDGNVRRINGIVRDHLNFSRIENEELKPATSRVELREEILTPLLESLEAVAEDRKITFVNTVAEDVVLQADLNMLREVFEALISSASKYSREGGMIKLAAQAESDFVRFRIFSDGEGIAPDKVEILLQQFSCFEEYRVARKKGADLGVFMSKYMIEAHGGAIYIETKPGEGVEFIFTLPRYNEESNNM